MRTWQVWSGFIPVRSTYLGPSVVDRMIVNSFGMCHRPL